MIGGESRLLASQHGADEIRLTVNGLVGDAQEMAANQDEETISERLMEFLGRLARVVGRHKGQWALLVDAAQGDDPGHRGKSENRDESKRHQAAKRIVSPVSGAATGHKPGEVRVDGRALNGKVEEPRIGRTDNAPQDAKGDETSNGGACRDVDVQHVSWPVKARDQSHRDCCNQEPVEQADTKVPDPRHIRSGGALPHCRFAVSTPTE